MMPGDTYVRAKEKQLWNALLGMDSLHLIDNIRYLWRGKFFQTSAFMDRPKSNLPDVFL